MSILKEALLSVLGVRTVKEPIFIKDFSSTNSQLEELIRLSKIVSTDKKEIIDRDIILMKYGIDGEQNVAYELSNSFIPMLCLLLIYLTTKF